MRAIDRLERELLIASEAAHKCALALTLAVAVLREERGFGSVRRIRGDGPRAEQKSDGAGGPIVSESRENQDELFD